MKSDYFLRRRIIFYEHRTRTSVEIFETAWNCRPSEFVTWQVYFPICDGEMFSIWNWTTIDVSFVKGHGSFDSSLLFWSQTILWQDGFELIEHSRINRSFSFSVCSSIIDNFGLSLKERKLSFFETENKIFFSFYKDFRFESFFRCGRENYSRDR